MNFLRYTKIKNRYSFQGEVLIVMDANQGQLKIAYIIWLNERITIYDLNVDFQITPPFLDVNNDRQQIYIIPMGNS